MAALIAMLRVDAEVASILSPRMREKIEWMAFAPEEVHPPREVLTRAAPWSVRAIEQLEFAEIKDQYAFATHAAVTPFLGIPPWR